jgi:hypothetical protein
MTDVLHRPRSRSRSKSASGPRWCASLAQVPADQNGAVLLDATRSTAPEVQAMFATRTEKPGRSARASSGPADGTSRAKSSWALSTGRTSAGR